MQVYPELQIQICADCGPERDFRIGEVEGILVFCCLLFQVEAPSTLIVNYPERIAKGEQAVGQARQALSSRILSFPPTRLVPPDQSPATICPCSPRTQAEKKDKICPHATQKVFITSRVCLGCGRQRSLVSARKKGLSHFWATLIWTPNSFFCSICRFLNWWAKYVKDSGLIGDDMAHNSECQNDSPSKKRSSFTV